MIKKIISAVSWNEVFPRVRIVGVKFIKLKNIYENQMKSKKYLLFWRTNWEIFSSEKFWYLYGENKRKVASTEKWESWIRILVVNVEMGINVKVSSSTRKREWKVFIRLFDEKTNRHEFLWPSDHICSVTHDIRKSQQKF